MPIIFSWQAKSQSSTVESCARLCKNGAQERWPVLRSRNNGENSCRVTAQRGGLLLGMAGSVGGEKPELRTLPQQATSGYGPARGQARYADRAAGTRVQE